MKIAVAIERFNPVGSGRERSTFQIVQALLARGHEVTVLCGDAPVKLALPGGHIRRAGFLDYKHQPKVKPFADWARNILESGEFPASLSVTTSTPAAVMQPRAGTCAGLAACVEQVPRLASPKMVERVLGALFSPRKGMLKLERDAFAHPMVRRVAVAGRQAAAELAREFGIASETIHVIPNGANLSAMDASQQAASRQKVRAGFGIADDAIVFLFAAHHPDVKGLTPLLHALKLLRDRDAHVTLLAAGNFPYHHQKLAATLGVRDQVKVAGVTEHMADLFAASDVAVHPTFYDAGSRMVVESLVTHTPVIASGYDGSSELVAGENIDPRGIVLDDPSDAAAIANAMRQMCDPAVRATFQSGSSGLEHSLSLERHVDALERLLDDAATSPAHND